jgi:dienelactone hydrolase
MAQLTRIEIATMPSVTLDSEQILIGDHAGERVTLAAELRLPASGAAKLPAVVLVHGSGGIGPSIDRWAWELNGIGIAAFIVDSFTGRGIADTVTDQTQLPSLAMMVDVYRALDLLSEDRRIDRQRIAIMGFSKGAVAALYSSLERFRADFARRGHVFAAHIGFYAPCNIQYRDDERTTGKPIRLFHGVADDYTPIGPCRAYAERLKRAGADIVLTEYAEGPHAFDDFSLPPLVEVPEGETTRACTLEEGAKGAVLDAITGRVFDLRTDPCVERGAHVGYDQAAHDAAVAAVKAFLTETFQLK